MTEPNLTAEVLDLLKEARRAYRSGDVREAQRLDEEALSQARRLGSEAGVARATRFLGLCAYRLGEGARSEALLREARSRAKALGWESEELLCCNHLGATLRKLGKLEEADQTFLEALGRAAPKIHIVARARLSANYGAFLDDLGEAQAAAEHYARAEELFGLLDAPARLANAHGLVSRSARLRGDAATALTKARLERDLGIQSQDPLCEARGWMHLAQAEAAHGQGEHRQRAEEGFRRAVEVAARCGEVRAPVEIAAAYGRFLLDQGCLPEAYRLVQQASKGLGALGDDEREHAARVAELAAEVAAAAGLHGEALWYLRQAIDHHLVRFAPISDPRLKARTRGRRRQLVDLAARLRRESGEVEREAHEGTAIDALVRRLDPEHSSQPTTEALSVEQWRRRVRDQATARWKKLMPGTFERLMPESQSDLVLSDLVYQGPVDDLGRSLGLIFASIERELRRVVGSRLDSKKGRKPGLSDLVTALDLRSPSGKTADLVEGIVQQGHALSSIQTLAGSAVRVDEQSTGPLIELRNDIAHGNPLQLTRLDVDAVRRVLLFGSDPVLPTLARLPTG